MAGLTNRLGTIAATLTYSDLPACAVEAIKRGAIDYMGVTLAASHEPVLAIAQSIFAIPGSTAQEATLLVNGTRTSSANAAMLNATAAHALDYDDTGLDGHPSVVLFSVALAEAERLQADGRRMIAAYAAGFEVWARLTEVDSDKIHAKGWHPSSTLGAIAAAAAAANLAGLSCTQATQALAIAASMAAGVVANFGSMMKPLQVGLAVGNGITAARLAAAGMIAADDALEHPSGLLAALSPAGRLDFAGKEIDGARAGSAIPTYGINIKRYPMCYAMHRALDALLDLCVQEHIDAKDIDRIVFSIGSAQAAILRQHDPRTPLEAKFSLEFGAACIVLRRAIALADLHTEWINSDAVRGLMGRVEIESQRERDIDEPLFSPSDTVEIRLLDGRVCRAIPVVRALGHARRPLDHISLQRKFDACSAPDLPSAEVRNRLFDRMTALETLVAPEEIFSLLKQGRATA